LNSRTNYASDGARIIVHRATNEDGQDLGCFCDADNNESSLFGFRLYCVGLYFMGKMHMGT